MSTVHNEANKGDIAKVVLMCGDPLRVKYIAENYLENPKLVNTVRNMYCYTGTYQGKEISVMGSGMGMPSIGIYSHELFNYYDVYTIIRVGTCGSIQKDIDIRDIIVVTGASTDSNYARYFDINETFSAVADFSLLSIASKVCEKADIKAHFGSVLTTDCFYKEDGYTDKWAKLGIMAVEMETYGLYTNASSSKKKAMSILSVSDSLVTKVETSSLERQEGFRKMMEIALDIAKEA